MAVRYPIESGNWSNTAIWNGGTLPTAADDVYANGFTVTIDQDITVLSIRTTAQAPAVAGGSYILNSGLTANLTGLNGIVAGTTNCVNYSAASGTSTINGVIRGSQTNINVHGIAYSGAASLNINGTVQSFSSGLTNFAIFKTGAGILNIIGDVIASLGTNGGGGLSNSGIGTINITGNIFGNQGSGFGHGIVNTGVCIINITGNLFAGTINAGNSLAISNTAAAQINITGNVFASTLNAGLETSAPLYLNIIGTLNAANGQSAIVSNSASAINLFSGPFISSTYGFMPFRCFRMHYIITPLSYFEFRDNSTNGALSPGPIAPATQLVSPDTVVDAPIQSNVRAGVTYALGTFTGTLAVPSPNSVALGVPTDNTTGSAVLTPSAIWDYATSNITNANTIGARLKNASTVDTTGAQLTAFL